MKILVIGSGGREHAIVLKCHESDPAHEIFCAPGNGGTSDIATNLSIAADDIERLLQYAIDNQVELVIVGPEAPLVLGIVDAFEKSGLNIVGPSAAAAQLEGSKDFAKAFMLRHSIPTAAYQSFTGEQLDEAITYSDSMKLPVVLKADGLAGGKGGVICETHEQAKETLGDMLKGEVFGSAGRRVVIEEFMEGEEVSVFAVTDGDDFVLLSPAQDHKRVGEGDTGPNTGGMGAYAPAPIFDHELEELVLKEIVVPTIQGMKNDGSPYKGFLYVGLMITSEGPKVVEYNCRMGDPETQVVLPLLKSDFVKLMMAVATGTVSTSEIALSSDYAACVVLASSGYPDNYEKGLEISGLEKNGEDDMLVFHAGTKKDEKGRYLTNGGRVLAATGRGQDLPSAIERAYTCIQNISFTGAFYRRDIGKKGLSRLE